MKKYNKVAASSSDTFGGDSASESGASKRSGASTSLGSANNKRVVALFDDAFEVIAAFRYSLPWYLYNLIIIVFETMYLFGIMNCK